jgi:hypothetical protein
MVAALTAAVALGARSSAGVCSKNRLLMELLKPGASSKPTNLCGSLEL